tara:strand:- start:211 stop:573 length:363 start_codon:yes stop_codon:yes gene_type:complete
LKTEVREGQQGGPGAPTPGSPGSSDLLKINHENLHENMHEEQISESLQKVYVLFEKGKIRPRALLWGARRYEVVQINSSWIDRSHRLPRHGFSLTVDSGEIFQVLYEGNATWKLEYILTD